MKKLIGSIVPSDMLHIPIILLLFTIPGFVKIGQLVANLEIVGRTAWWSNAYLQAGQPQSWVLIPIFNLHSIQTGSYLKGTRDPSLEAWRLKHETDHTPSPSAKFKNAYYHSFTFYIL